MVCLVGLAVKTLHNQRRMDAVKIADGKVAVHDGIAEAHVLGAGVASPRVAAVMHFVVVQFVAGYLGTRLAVDN